MPDIEIHQRENQEDIEQHLQVNIDKFKGDVLFVFRLMCNGRRFSGKSLMQEFGIHDRRLRDLYAEREYIKRKSGWEIKKEWHKNEKGKNEYVEYWAESPKRTTKNDLQQWFRDFQNEQQKPSFIQGQLL
jgi:hypothetical protein